MKPEAVQAYSMDEQVVIITGGAGMLGQAYSRILATAGAHVIPVDVDGPAAQSLAENITKDSGVEAMAVQADIAVPEEVRTLVSVVMERYGRIDVLVNNAAINPKFDQDHTGEHVLTFENFPFDEWQRSLAVNVGGMFLCAQAVAEPMRTAGKGVIINISSTYGIAGPDQRLYQREGEPAQYKPVTYTVSKAAAIGLTRYLATYFAGTGIRVNTLTPGGVFANHDDEFVKRYSARTVLGRMAERDEMANALLFLASDASSYMTGANLVVDGGWTAW